jgi:hypothetical protein
MQEEVGLLVTDVMPICVIIAMNIMITMRFSIDCPIVICLLTVCYCFEREASSEKYVPWVYFYHIIKIKNSLLQFYTFLFIYLSLSELILASNEFKGIGNPLASVGCKYLLLCV